MTEFHVEPAALDQFAAASADRAAQLGDLRNQMDYLRVPRDSFGYVPGIGNRVYAAYEEFLAGAGDSLWSATESLHEAADTVRKVTDSYRASDTHAADALQIIQEGLSTMDVCLRESR